MRMSPPAWGWPVLNTIEQARTPDVPTRVGMARIQSNLIDWLNGCPHPRGDGPTSRPRWRPCVRMSPPAWGWPDPTTGFRVQVTDVPTRVGMARTASTYNIYQR